MPVKIPSKLPAKELLEAENIFVMTQSRASVQDIRPLHLAILNLMPNKEVTETQLLRLIGNTPLQVEITLLRTASYTGTHTDQLHLSEFYTTFREAREAKTKFDGLIITGAPVERMDFSSVAYWDELSAVMDYAKNNVYSTMYICWAAQAGVFYHYGIPKHELNCKLSGIYSHKVTMPKSPLVRGFDEYFYAPHSRYTAADNDAIKSCNQLDVIAESQEAGVYLAASKDSRHVFVFGHGEYDKDTLDAEYFRDKSKGLDINPPANYYDKNKTVLPLCWRAHESLFISNWLNYCVYQSTPYDINAIGKGE